MNNPNARRLFSRSYGLSPRSQQIRLRLMSGSTRSSDSRREKRRLERLGVDERLDIMRPAIEADRKPVA